MTSTYAPTVARADACAPRPTNGFAITAFILSILGWFLLSIPFGFVALHQIKQRGEDGRGLAIASLVISAVQICVFIAAVVAIALYLGTSHPAPPVY